MEDNYEIVKQEGGSHLRIKAKKGGELPRALSGVFTKEAIAKHAIATYVSERQKYKPESTPEIELDKLTKKAHLLEFAEKVMNVEVPEDISQPASIKKYLKEKLEA